MGWGEISGVMSSLKRFKWSPLRSQAGNEVAHLSNQNRGERTSVWGGGGVAVKKR